MENFEIYNPVRAYFGKDVIGNLPKELKNHGSKVLLVYGKGSIKKNGVYDAVMEQLQAFGAEVTEFEGIKSNPLIGDVRDAVSLGKEKGVEVVLAVGGGSVLDSAKMIALGIAGEDDPWDYVKGNKKPLSALPILVVLTLAATGTETNRFAVVQNPETLEKLGFGSKFIYPAAAFLDPSYTFSVSADYTAFGITDLIAHSLEAWFGDGDASLSDRFVTSIIREAMDYGPQLMENLEDYDLRARIMYAATMALNNLTVYGRVSGDWGVHSIGHVISVLYDMPHGASLSIAYPAWLRLHADRAGERIIQLGESLFRVDTIEDTVKGFEDFFTRINSPVRISQTAYGEYSKAEILDALESNQAGGAHHKLSSEDYHKLVELMW